MIRLRHLFWIALRGCKCLFVAGLPGSLHHMGAACVIDGRTTAVYSSLALFMDGPQVDAMTRDRASNAARRLLAALWMCSFHVSLGSTHTPSIHRVVSGFTRPEPIRTWLARALVGSRLHLVKCMSWYFSGVHVVA